MALIKCSECGKDVSDSAVSCPNCGNPLKDTTIHYEQKTEQFRCFGFGAGKKSLDKKLKKYTDEGWEVVSIGDAPNMLGLGFLYNVVLRRPKN